jgi:hypothetical protein
MSVSRKPYPSDVSDCEWAPIAELAAVANYVIAH